MKKKNRNRIQVPFKYIQTAYENGQRNEKVEIIYRFTECGFSYLGSSYTKQPYNKIKN